MVAETSSGIKKMFSEAGLIGFAYFHIFLTSLENNILWYRLLVFTSFLAATLCLYQILLRLKVLKPTECLILTLYFALFPVNTMKVALITSTYSFCYGLFFLAFWLTTQYIETKKRLFYRIAALVLFWGAFCTYSFLVLYAIVLMYILYAEGLKNSWDIKWWGINFYECPISSYCRYVFGFTSVYFGSRMVSTRDITVFTCSRFGILPRSCRPFSIHPL